MNIIGLVAFRCHKDHKLMNSITQVVLASSFARSAEAHSIVGVALSIRKLDNIVY